MRLEVTPEGRGTGLLHALAHTLRALPGARREASGPTPPPLRPRSGLQMPPTKAAIGSTTTDGCPIAACTGGSTLKRVAEGPDRLEAGTEAPCVAAECVSKTALRCV